MATEFNIRELFSAAFGYEAPPDFSLEQKEAERQISGLGQPYYKTDLYGREFFLPVELNKYLLPFAVVGIATKKNIVSTPLVKRQGTVNELISIDNYVINIKGIAISQNDDFPETELKDFEELYQLNESLIMRCALTDIFLSGAFEHRVILKAMNFPAVSGVQHAKPYEFEFISYQILKLTID